MRDAQWSRLSIFCSEIYLIVPKSDTFSRWKFFGFLNLNFEKNLKKFLVVLNYLMPLLKVFFLMLDSILNKILDNYLNVQI